MAIELHTLRPKKSAKRPAKRVGRGLSSPHGAKSGRGTKGQRKRSGVRGLKRLGMRQLIFATPKLRGFRSRHPKPEVVNVQKLADAFEKGEFVTPKALAKRGLIKSARSRVKILGDGDINVAVKVKGCAVSTSAAEKIKQAGGEIVA